MSIREFLRKVVNKLLNKNSIEEKIASSIAVSGKMSDAIDIWRNLYMNTPPWIGGKDGIIPMNNPAAISGEFARLITIEMKSEISGDSAFSEYLNKQYKKVISNLENKIEVYCAKGGIAMKPYVSGNRILVDFTQAENFYPTSYNSNGEITGAVFVDFKRVGKYLYTRLEQHELNGTTYTVTNKAFQSEQLFDDPDGDILSAKYPLQNQVPLNTVPDWEMLSEEPVVINNIERPLFVYVKVPRANNIDVSSPLGVSVYSRAIEMLEVADRQFTEILHEYKALEAAVFAANDLFKLDKTGEPLLPEGEERVFKTFDMKGMTNGTALLKEFAPQFRDTSLFNGLNNYLQRIELLCDLAYGTISVPPDVEKTATEIKASKQRSYSTVRSMQNAWDEGLEHLVYAMSVLAILYNLAPYGEYGLYTEWGDGILEDAEVEYQRRWGQVVAGKLKVEKFYAWYYGISEKEALDLIPDKPKSFPDEE